MANVNINRSIDDTFYRYKMPKIIAKVEGKGNGIKTVIVNMPEVAKALDRPPTYPTKYFGCELGAQTQFDMKNERFIVNGSHEAAKLQNLLDGFIKRFVLCAECENPETNIAILQKRGTISLRCIACGHTTTVDMRHKLTTFILKNPPEQDASAATPSKKTKEKKKDKKGAKGETVNGDSSDAKDKAAGSASSKRRSKQDEDDDDDDWSADTSPAAVQQRMGELTSAAKGMTLHDDLEKSQQERINIFYSFVKKRKVEDRLSGSEKEIMGEAERLDIKDQATMILAELLWDSNIMTQIPKYRKLFLRFTHENQKAQWYMLGGFEQLVGKVFYETLMPKVVHILKAFYDNDIIEEEVLLEWSTKSSKYVSKELSKEMRQKSEPFLIWLKEAEEESDDESDEDVEVVYSHTEKVGTQSIPKAAPEKKQEEAEDDDFDIDDI